MLRQTIINVIRPAHRSTVGQVRSFSMSAIRSTEGATGAPRSGGTAQGDSFTKREKANEDYYVKQQEKAKLLALKEKISQQRKQLEELDKNIEELTKEGEQK
ncbi:atpase mitochondrial [Lasallia pustulata]|uniref:ATPase inhibitor, mitochondrial n=1 Tax=Lasallia pustulata TaxID=136370 RepID=A0A1W5D103_9LECA|nr:atpase mitochondrial [Lasallia pustulata]